MKIVVFAGCVFCIQHALECETNHLNEAMFLRSIKRYAGGKAVNKATEV